MSAIHAWPDEHSADHGLRHGYVRRKTHRVSLPALVVSIRGRRYAVDNWSLSGLLIASYDSSLQSGDLFEIDTISFFHKRTWPVMIQARVVRRDNDAMAAQFTALNTLAFDVLEGVLLRREAYRSVA